MIRGPRIARVAWAFGLACGLAPVANGADATKQENLIDHEAQNSSLFSFNYGPPSATSVDLLGLDTSKISPATGFGPFVLSVPSAFDGSGGQYAGIDLSPAWLFKHTRVSQYPGEHEYLRAELLRLRLDFGLTNGVDAKDASKQKASAVAAGFALPLLQANNPLTVRWNGAAAADGSYFQQCLNNSKATFLHLAMVNHSASSASDPEASDLNNRILNVQQGYATQAQMDQLLGELIARYGTRAAPKPPKPPVTEDDILGNAITWAKENHADPDATPILALAQMLAAIDGLSPEASGAPLSRQDALPPLLRFLKLQPADKPGISPFIDLLEKAGAGQEAAPPAGAAPAKREAILAYQGQVSDDAKAAETADQKIIDANVKASGAAAIVADCAKGASVLAASQADFSVGAGYRRAGDPGHLKNINDGGYSLWMSWRFPLAHGVQGFSNTDKAPPFAAINAGKVRYLMVGGSLRYDHSARFSTGDSTTPLVDTNKLDAWLGLEGYNGWARLAAQGGYTKVDVQDRSLAQFDQHGWRWLTSGSVKVGDAGFWLGATYGNANGTTTKLHDKTFLLTVFLSPPNASGLLGNGTPSKKSQ